ncbi:hypothetical protein BH18VER1_BH18VER1_01690 [soil metagenome]
MVLLSRVGRGFAARTGFGRGVAAASFFGPLCAAVVVSAVADGDGLGDGVGVDLGVDLGVGVGVGGVGVSAGVAVALGAGVEEGSGVAVWPAGGGERRIGAAASCASAEFIAAEASTTATSRCSVVLFIIKTGSGKVVEHVFRGQQPFYLPDRERLCTKAVDESQLPHYISIRRMPQRPFLDTISRGSGVGRSPASFLRHARLALRDL